MPHQCTDCSHVFPDGSKAMLSGCPDCGGNTFQFLPEGAVPDGELDDAAAPGVTDTSANTEATPADAGEAPSASGRVPVESAESTNPADTDDTDEEPVAPPEPPREPPPSRGRLERATDAVRSFVFDSPTTRRPRKPERANADESGTDAGSDPGVRPEDTIEPADGSTRNEGDEPAKDGPAADTEAGGPAPNAADAAADDTRTNGTATEPSADADIEAGTDPDSRSDLDTSVGSEDSQSPTPDAADARTPPAGVEAGRIAAEPAEDRPDLEELRRELNDQFESIRIVEPGQYELNLMELYNREEYIIALREDGRYAIEAPETWLGRRADRE